MNPQTLDYLAIGLALGGIVLRLPGKPWFASILCSVSPAVFGRGAIDRAPPNQAVELRPCRRPRPRRRRV